MLKKLEAIILVGILALVGVYLYVFKFSDLRQPSPASTPSERPISPLESSTPSLSYCTENDLKATIQSEGAAGNIYTILMLENISGKDCTIVLGNTIKAKYTATNIATSYQNNESQNYNLVPNGKVYSQVHYPNGPQCQSSISPQEVSLSYEANNVKINFDTITVSACSGNEITTIDIGSLSNNSFSL